MRIVPKQARPIPLATGARHVLVVPRPRAHVLELAAVLFHTDGSVLLPYTTGSNDAVGGLRLVLAAVLRFASEQPGKRLLVAGHADSTGSAAHNLTRSRRRARSVYLYLAGERAAWAQDADRHGTALDVQKILSWLTRHHGWDCDPGPLDGVFGPRTAGALDRVREAEGAAASGAPAGLRDWERFFDLYERVLACQLGKTAEELAGMRARLGFTDPPVLACGEHQPRVQRSVDGHAAAENRRVDLVFFDAGEVPDLGAEPPGQRVYQGRHVFTPIEVAPLAMLTIRVVGDDGAPLVGATVRVSSGAGEQELVTDAGGAVHFTGELGEVVEVLSVRALDPSLVLSRVHALAT